MTHDDEWTSAGCIRGPDLADPARISAEIRAADPAALAVYQEGTAQLQRVRALLDDAERLPELRRTRAFLVHQLRALEQADPVAVARALRGFDAARQLGAAAPESDAP